MATLQVRSIDDQLYKALGRRATMDNRSISQEVVAILKNHLSLPITSHTNRTNEFLEMCGSWQDERSDKEISEEIRQDRRTGKRFTGDIF
jgi:plasmid stability protein